MAYQLIWAERAFHDLNEIILHISIDSEQHARNFAQQMIEQVETIPLMQFAGRVVPEVKEFQFVREKIVRSYRLIYRIQSETIDIVRIFNQARILVENDI